MALLKLVFQITQRMSKKESCENAKYTAQRKKKKRIIIVRKFLWNYTKISCAKGKIHRIKQSRNSMRIIVQDLMNYAIMLLELITGCAVKSTRNTLL